MIIEIGSDVLVSPKQGREFTATVLSYNVVQEYYVVEDQDGDVFCPDCVEVKELV